MILKKAMQPRFRRALELLAEGKTRAEASVEMACNRDTFNEYARKAAKAMEAPTIERAMYLLAVRQHAQENVLEVDLTPREFEIVKCMSAGLSNKQIAHELSMAESTVKNHTADIYRKFGLEQGAGGRLIAVLLAHKLGLVDAFAMITQMQNGQYEVKVPQVKRGGGRT